MIAGEPAPATVGDDGGRQVINPKAAGQLVPQLDDPVRGLSSSSGWEISTSRYAPVFGRWVNGARSVRAGRVVVGRRCPGRAIEASRDPHHSALFAFVGQPIR